MDLSVVLCTWNNSRRLCLTLAALARCAVPEALEWELVVVNNNCTDDTEAVVAGFRDLLPVRHVREPRQGLSIARNRGIATATGTLVVFTDDDVTPSAGWLTAYWDAYRRHDREHYFGGPVDSAFEAAPPEPELLRLAPYSVKGLDWGPTSRPLRETEAFIGANWACPADAVAAAGGFDERMGLNGTGRLHAAEETDFMRRLRRMGFSAYYVAEARLTHWVSGDKCRLDHIAARMEDSKYYWTTVRAHDGHQAGSRARREAELAAAGLWIKWLWARARRRRASREYVQWRGAVGTAAALRDVTRAARSRAPRPRASRRRCP